MTQRLATERFLFLQSAGPMPGTTPAMYGYSQIASWKFGLVDMQSGSKLLNVKRNPKGLLRIDNLKWKVLDQ
jgi:hypothetical protein